MNHRTTAGFWQYYEALPRDAQKRADKNFELLKANPRHPSLHFKKIGDLWSVRVGLQHRALARERSDGIYWFWIGHHDEYDRLIE